MGDDPHSATAELIMGDDPHLQVTGIWTSSVLCFNLVRSYRGLIMIDSVFSYEVQEGSSNE